MLESIADLTRTRPHVHENARLSAQEFQTYRDGYYQGVIFAMKAAELGAERFKLRVKTLAAESRRKKSA